MAGNYGGNSIPTTPIGGLELLAGAGGIYKNYKCTSVVSSGATGSFSINNNLFSLGALGQSIDLVINPRDVTAVSTVYFLCYECSGCDTLAFSGITTPGEGGLVDPYAGMSGMNKPTIIGGGGLNN